VKQRDLNDNLRLLDLSKEVSEIERKLEKLQEELGDLNFVDLMERKNKLNSSILNIMSKVYIVKVYLAFFIAHFFRFPDWKDPKMNSKAKSKN